ncbi:dihydrolipoamide acetyltransferase family protein [Mycoplasma capricolum]|uniref:Dihydrolipoyllysine-residue acetyltransferase component of pyruvate dehydrogenase complex n=2 Tax=Mycoplasma capricolum subsp. capricolum TaxID=40479 RepID=ODP2_MYCCT|nr:dihydrolipoamide acetyltransferase family protein [Mycoplasma capricolum]Q49110.1 RecName: Full=Dihydrolipoyllysine-residue acetyltransferase component of pyruvate dehydrogenase complex; AltName: Full=Dihydrolipoamide acetyltransferase component of pyruvate dehydrogenase complex; AltName: Full=E2 [Mycoplasma capricolum subsp. capricolum ATCC 27343]AAC44344.1 pyruvate dehydrogenase EII [Mycoplasma capricolum]ABC01559.1 pyruvate dehydrogenase complex, EII component, dihydrolipoamide acetyltrans
MFKVKFADIGEGLTEGTVAEVLVKVGDVVKEGQSLYFVETDKVNSEIPAPVAGKIAVINIKAGQEIKVGDVVMEIEDGSDTSATSEPKAETKSEAKVEVVEENASVVGATPVSNDVIVRKQTTTVNKSSTIKATPLARKVAADLNIDLSLVTPTGPNQRILVADIKNHQASSTQLASQPISQPAPTPSPSAHQTIAPTIKVVEPSAPLSWDEVPMNGVRKATVKAMTKSHTEIAAFTGMKNTDITETHKMRTELKDHAAASGIKLTYLAFIIKAVAKSLRDMPNINVRGDFANNKIQFMHNINIGIAVDTPNGLMVPVIKGADHLSVFEIAIKISELANKAKDGKLTRAEMTEATFTVSNFGSVGLDYATPIINSPESAILGVGTMSQTPLYINGELQKRFIMPLSMTCDHRIIDGADAGRFLIKVQDYLSKPVLLFM